jgi:hypothetical protein
MTYFNLLLINIKAMQIVVLWLMAIQIVTSKKVLNYL